MNPFQFGEDLKMKHFLKKKKTLVGKEMSSLLRSCNLRAAATSVPPARTDYLRNTMSYSFSYYFSQIC